MKKGGKEVKEKRVTSLLGEEEGEGGTGDELSQVGPYQGPIITIHRFCQS